MLCTHRSQVRTRQPLQGLIESVPHPPLFVSSKHCLVAFTPSFLSFQPSPHLSIPSSPFHFSTLPPLHTTTHTPTNGPGIEKNFIMWLDMPSVSPSPICATLSLNSSSRRSPSGRLRGASIGGQDKNSDNHLHMVSCPGAIASFPDYTHAHTHTHTEVSRLGALASFPDSTYTMFHVWGGGRGGYRHWVWAMETHVLPVAINELGMRLQVSFGKHWLL